MINLICEKSNFDFIIDAADYYYPRWESEVMDTYQIRDELARLGHNEDFIDAVIDSILNRYDDEERYEYEHDYDWDDFDESVSRKKITKESHAYNLDSSESRRKEMSDRFGRGFKPDDHMLVCKDGKIINVQIGRKYKCSAMNGQRVEIVSIDDRNTDDRGESAMLTVLHRGRMYNVASTQLYESKELEPTNKINEGYDDKERYKIAENIASWAFGSPNMNDIDDNIDFIVNRFLKRSSLVDRIYMCDTYEELAEVLSECSLKLLMSIERGLCIDEDSVSCETDYIRKMYGESYRSLNEEDAQIEVKHEDILEVPEGKNVDDLPMSHFEKLAKKKGLGKITKALNNLQVWNKNDDKKLSKWAGDMIDKLNKKLKKDESLLRESLKWEVVHESDDDEGNPTMWSAKIDHDKYGKYIWIEMSDKGGYDVVINVDDDWKVLKNSKSMSGAKKYANDLISGKINVSFDDDDIDESFVRKESLGGRDYIYLDPVLQEYLDFLDEAGIEVINVIPKNKTIYVNDRDFDDAVFYMQDRDYFGKDLHSKGWVVATRA